jgi:hypothetical protein
MTNDNDFNAYLNAYIESIESMYQQLFAQQTDNSYQEENLKKLVRQTNNNSLQEKINKDAADINDKRFDILNDILNDDSPIDI